MAFDLFHPLQIKEVNKASLEYKQLDEEYQAKTRLSMQDQIKELKELDEDRTMALEKT